MSRSMNFLLSLGGRNPSHHLAKNMLLPCGLHLPPLLSPILKGYPSSHSLLGEGSRTFPYHCNLFSREILALDYLLLSYSSLHWKHQGEFKPQAQSDKMNLQFSILQLRLSTYNTVPWLVFYFFICCGGGGSSAWFLFSFSLIYTQQRILKNHKISIFYQYQKYQNINIFININLESFSYRENAVYVSPLPLLPGLVTVQQKQWIFIKVQNTA